ncbi:MAG: class I SAM-dependent methyltransferase [candidate division WOR-3 bacterium]|nr:class I SAM-dependent methyltransferase [candidate division WOR-3 bacterium]MCX7836592.1 class I SAM-dependent methyltransferase [candidate division WOR-3 bacterium]MDW8114156.1 class I SAM-dependent methyltransferase [candidate division WOR-3 bacterium]
MERCFSKFAQFYDEFMLKLVDYKNWVGYVISIWNFFNLKPKVVLDLACGTGIPSIILLKKGYQIIGVDKSKEMLEVFKRKIESYPDLKNKVIIIESDITNFNLDTQVDACVSFYDSINYLLKEEDLEKCFSLVYKFLKEKGIFSFDMNTIFVLENFWANNKFVRESKNIKTIWENQFDKKLKISTLYLKCYPKNKQEFFTEIHQERGYEYKTIIKILKKVGFKKIKIFQHLTFLPAKKDSLRVMFVALK